MVAKCRNCSTGQPESDTPLFHPAGSAGGVFSCPKGVFALNLQARIWSIPTFRNQTFRQSRPGRLLNRQYTSNRGRILHS